MVSNGRPPPVRSVSPQNSAHGDSVHEDLPIYSAQPEYASVPHDEQLVRSAVKVHEKKLKRDLAQAKRAEIQCERIKKILPQIYEQLNEAVNRPRSQRIRTGPAALRRQEDLDSGIEICFKSRGIDQQALRDYLPVLLSDYQRQMEAEETSDTVGHSADMITNSNTIDRTRSAPEPYHNSDGLLQSEGLLANTRQESLTQTRTAGATRYYDPERLSVEAGYFERYSQKIYFSKNFVNLWKKKESGKRDNLASGIAMVLVGMKIGLPMFDLFTFAILDVPRLALQGITGKQKLKLQD